MNEGWVKLHRKINENDLMTDTNASHVFLWLLVNVDRKTGSIKIGRFWLAKILKMKPSTLRDTLYRLRDKYQIADIETTTEYSKISLKNWGRYQSNEKNPTTRRQRDDTLQEVENKEIRIESTLSYLLNIPTLDREGFREKFQCSEAQVVNKGESLYNYCKAKGRQYKDYKAFLRNALQQDFGPRVGEFSGLDYIAQKEAELNAELEAEKGILN